MHSPKNLEVLEEWVDKTLADSTLTESMKNRLRMLARAELDLGGIKGDISDSWRKAYPVEVNTVTVPDLYV